MTWKTLGALPPDRLSEARLQLHWAAQLLSAPGVSLLPAENDFSHTNLHWDFELGVLSGRPVGSESLRAGLVFESLELAVLDGERERSSVRLAGHSLEQGLSWLGRELTGGGSQLDLPQHDMPSHLVGEGGVFSEAHGPERTELGAWFANAFRSIRGAVAGDLSASPVRCWPHHFDVASLITLDADVDAEEARSIGVGFSPGDGSYDQPYFYVTPWPYPKTANLPQLGRGMEWHRSGWTGAVLTAERLISVPPAEQEHTAREALGRALAASREILGN
ncbi:MAG: hypothetical protein KJO40_13290 [Deltaproteobacteria bacterium]|nr:hypothetical protein [Deltaproteobacteria bacterium]NND27901.1 hypothetical protein [Myxococcales bacterium]MBT8465367.1 hypothetical protein [Deltaproteobacteria bacterium]MBT8481759.1 hypothetical protein [Deltaproteobacteria bacterium]NNK08353.1 hypothetical protein [Myxococcales bacterium]